MKKLILLNYVLTLLVCISCQNDDVDFIDQQETTTKRRIQPFKPVLTQIQRSCGITEGNDQMPVSAGQMDKLVNTFVPLSPINVTV